METTKKALLKEYILKSIDATGYNVEQPTTDKEKIKFLIDTFRSEYINKNVLRQYGSYQNVFTNWLRGLPSCIDLPIHNNEIFLQAVEFGFLTNNSTSKQIDKFIENYYNIVFMAILSISKKYKLDNLLFDYSEILTK